MKKDYSFGKTKIPDPLGPPRTKPVEPVGKRQRREYHFNGLSDTPRRIKYLPHKQGFAVRIPAPNVGKAVGLFLTASIPAFLLFGGSISDGADDFKPRLVLTLIILGFVLASIYNLVRRHVLRVVRGEFEFSSGYGIFRSRQKGKLRNIKSARIDSKRRSVGEQADTDESDGEFASGRYWYLSVHLKDGSYFHAMEGASELNLNYISFALRKAVAREKA